MKGSHLFQHWQWVTVSQFSTLIKQMSSTNDASSRSEQYGLWLELSSSLNHSYQHFRFLSFILSSFFYLSWQVKGKDQDLKRDANELFLSTKCMLSDCKVIFPPLKSAIVLCRLNALINKLGLGFNFNFTRLANLPED